MEQSENLLLWNDPVMCPFRNILNICLENIDTDQMSSEQLQNFLYNAIMSTGKCFNLIKTRTK